MKYSQKRIKALKRMNEQLRTTNNFLEQRYNELRCENYHLLNYKLKELIEDENMIGYNNFVIGWDEEKVKGAIIRWSDKIYNEKIKNKLK